ncbi:MAG: glycosyltransferase family 39 protein [Pyrinomonadaceae bacterium]|nr:glycosyltransferase family 39 protein [Pyrinomonadaceae bacterium]
MDQSLKGQVRVAGESRTDVAPGRVLEMLKQFVLAHRAEVVCACLLLLMAINLFAAISRKSITNDEIVHIPAGYYHLVAGDFHLNNEHPPLVKMWAVLPLLFIQPEEPSALDARHEGFMERTWGFHQRFWQANRARFGSITFWTRAMMVPLTLTLGALIFIYSRKLFGETAGLFAVALYVFEPTVLAHGRVVHTDVPAALAYLLFIFALHSYGNAPSVKRALLLGLACGIALVTKFSMIVIGPVLALAAVALFCVSQAPSSSPQRSCSPGDPGSLRSAGALHKWLGQGRKQLLLHAVLVVAVVLFLVNAVYDFQSPALEASDVRWVKMMSEPLFGSLMKGLAVVSKLVPTYFLFGLYNIVIHNQYGHSASLLGAHNDLGWWYYFPVAFALKTTIPFLLLSIAALVWSLYRLVMTRERVFAFVLVPFGIYLAISLTSHINIGIRHLLPAYPFLFIASGALLDRLLRVEHARRAVFLFLALILGWMAYEAVRSFPDYIPYTNQLAGRQPGWRNLSDSNVEWGDDMGELATYLKARGETRVTAVLSAGWSTLTQYDVEYVDLLSLPAGATPDTRYVAIGASFLNGSTVPGGVDGRETTEKRTNFFARYRDRQPEIVFGGSIYLYRIRE